MHQPPTSRPPATSKVGVMFTFLGHYPPGPPGADGRRPARSSSTPPRRSATPARGSVLSLDGFVTQVVHRLPQRSARSTSATRRCAASSRSPARSTTSRSAGYLDLRRTPTPDQVAATDRQRPRPGPAPASRTCRTTSCAQRSPLSACASCAEPAGEGGDDRAQLSRVAALVLLQVEEELGGERREQGVGREGRVRDVAEQQRDVLEPGAVGAGAVAGGGAGRVDLEQQVACSMPRVGSASRNASRRLAAAHPGPSGGGPCSSRPAARARRRRPAPGRAGGRRSGGRACPWRRRPRARLAHRHRVAAAGGEQAPRRRRARAARLRAASARSGRRSPRERKLHGSNPRLTNRTHVRLLLS